MVCQHSNDTDSYENIPLKDSKENSCIFLAMSLSILNILFANRVDPGDLQTAGVLVVSFSPTVGQDTCTCTGVCVYMCVFATAFVAGKSPAITSEQVSKCKSLTLCLLAHTRGQVRPGRTGNTPRSTPLNAPVTKRGPYNHGTRKPVAGWVNEAGKVGSLCRPWRCDCGHILLCPF